MHGIRRPRTLVKSSVAALLSPLLGERARVRGLFQALRGPSSQPSPAGRGSKTGILDRGASAPTLLPSYLR